MILSGSTAIVTGGAVRIGREIARRLAAEGMNLCIHYGRSHEEAESTVIDLREMGVRAEAVQADLGKPVASARSLFSQANEAMGEITVLVNSAAIFESGTILKTDESDWDRHHNINLKAPFFLTQQFARQLSEDSSGCVINILDWRALRPPAGHAAYTISKAGLAAQTKVLAQELGPRIRVNAVAPGAILPPPGGSEREFEERGSQNSLQKTGEPSDVSEAVIFLLKAAFTTGEIVHVTGGEQL